MKARASPLSVVGHSRSFGLPVWEKGNPVKDGNNLSLESSFLSRLQYMGERVAWGNWPWELRAECLYPRGGAPVDLD